MNKLICNEYFENKNIDTFDQTTTDEKYFMFNNTTNTIFNYDKINLFLKTIINIPSKINNIDVKSIDNGVFINNTNFTNVILPNTVTSIGDYAFYGCSNLTNIALTIAFSR